MLAPGTLLQSRYRVVRLLRRGTRWLTYEAMDERLSFLARAIQYTTCSGRAEAEAVLRMLHTRAALRHRALLTVFDCFADVSDVFLITEFVEGFNLDDVLRRTRCPLPLPLAASVADQLLSALEYLHDHVPPIVHGAIEPSSLSLTTEQRLLLLGGAAAGADWAPVQRYPHGALSPYMAIEQLEGCDATPRTDLYAAATTLYHLLTGCQPPGAIYRRHEIVDGRADPMKPATELNSSVPLGISRALATAASIDAAPRHRSARELRTALRQEFGWDSVAIPRASVGAAPPACVFPNEYSTGCYAAPPQQKDADPAEVAWLEALKRKGKDNG